MLCRPTPAGAKGNDDERRENGVVPPPVRLPPYSPTGSLRTRVATSQRSSPRPPPRLGHGLPPRPPGASNNLPRVPLAARSDEDTAGGGGEDEESNAALRRRFLHSALEQQQQTISSNVDCTGLPPRPSNAMSNAMPHVGPSGRLSEQELAVVWMIMYDVLATLVQQLAFVLLLPPPLYFAACRMAAMEPEEGEDDVDAIVEEDVVEREEPNTNSQQHHVYTVPLFNYFATDFSKNTNNYFVRQNYFPTNLFLGSDFLPHIPEQRALFSVGNHDDLDHTTTNSNQQPLTIKPRMSAKRKVKLETKVKKSCYAHFNWHTRDFRKRSKRFFTKQPARVLISSDFMPTIPEEHAIFVLGHRYTVLERMGRNMSSDELKELGQKVVDAELRNRERLEAHREDSDDEYCSDDDEELGPRFEDNEIPEEVHWWKLMMITHPSEDWTLIGDRKAFRRGELWDLWEPDPLCEQNDDDDRCSVDTMCAWEKESYASSNSRSTLLGLKHLVPDFALEVSDDDESIGELLPPDSFECSLGVVGGGGDDDFSLGLSDAESIEERLLSTNVNLVSFEGSVDDDISLKPSDGESLEEGIFSNVNPDSFKSSVESDDDDADDDDDDDISLESSSDCESLKDGLFSTSVNLDLLESPVDSDDDDDGMSLEPSGGGAMKDRLISTIINDFSVEVGADDISADNDDAIEELLPVSPDSSSFSRGVNDFSVSVSDDESSVVELLPLPKRTNLLEALVEGCLFGWMGQRK